MLKTSLNTFRIFKEHFPPIREKLHKDKSYKMTHYVYNLKEIENLEVYTYEPKTIRDKLFIETLDMLTM
jgi:hypothetical protein